MGADDYVLNCRFVLETCKAKLELNRQNDYRIDTQCLKESSK